MENISDLEKTKLNQRIIREENKKFIKIFSGKIPKTNFILEIKESVWENLGRDIFYFLNSNENLLDFINNIDSKISYSIGHYLISYRICCCITGMHKFNLLFLNEQERLDLEKSKNYKCELRDKIVDDIKLNKYTSNLSREQALTNMGEYYIYFPILYDCLAMTNKSILILQNQKNQNINGYYNLYFKICYKLLAALSLLENGLVENSFPILRGALELFVKLLFLKNSSPKVLDEFNNFIAFDTNKLFVNGEKYPDGFEIKFKNRKIQEQKNKTDYLQYGYVDMSDDYHKVVKKRPYSFHGLVHYLDYKFKEQNTCHNFKYDIDKVYNLCHAFTHGSTGGEYRPLEHFLNFSFIAIRIIESLFNCICIDYDNIEDEENQFILKKFDDDRIDFEKKYNQATTEIIEQFYQNK